MLIIVVHVKDRLLLEPRLVYGGSSGLGLEVQGIGLGFRPDAASALWLRGLRPFKDFIRAQGLRTLRV